MSRFMFKFKVIMGVLLSLFIFAGVANALLLRNSYHEGEFYIISHEVKKNGDEDRYRIYAVSKEDFISKQWTKPKVFENHDTILFVKFNSADVQARLLMAEKSTEPIQLGYYGIRLPFFSLFPNIVTVKEENNG